MEEKNEFIFSKLSEICKSETIYDCIMENENNTEKDTIDKEELEKYKVARALNREMKLLFDRNNIGIPFPQLVIHQEEENKE